MDGNGDKLFYAKLEDMADRCEKNSMIVFSRFLDERQCILAQQWCSRNTGSLKFMLWGGFPQAKRKILAIYPDYCESFVKDEFPLKCLTFTYRQQDILTHRDFLGTLMGMELKRETVGDIVTDEGIAQVFVTDVVAGLVSAGVRKIGRTGVKVYDDRPFSLEPKQEYREITGTVASLRLDCIVSLAAGTGREKAAALIRAEKTDVNHFTVTSLSHELHEGDIISVRGCGRFILSSVGGITAKKRIHILLKKFI
ncbi:MAG: RNA-binding protein [Ruminococcus sp.]|nr:RNA-binding protein [Ruminococcus sp.]MBR6385094.1 RNA-binding protein [Ruminococcus sp.]